MFKFFRKYQRVIILVGLPILLVIFLVPQAIQGIGNYVAQHGRSIGTYVNPLTGEQHTIKAAEFMQAQQQLGVITQGVPGFNLGLAFRVGEIDRPAHWLLLVEEAKTLELIGGTDDAQNLAGEIALALSQGADEPMTASDVIIQLARSSGASPQIVLETLKNMRGVQRLVQLYQGAGKLSDSRIQLAADEMLRGIDARTVVISADGEIDEKAGEEPLPEPAEDDMLAQMKKYAEDAPGAGERGFGYRLPNRVHVEWIEIDPEVVRDRLSNSEKMSRLEVRKHWLTNKAQFLPPGVTDPESVKFEDVEERVHDAMLAQLTDQTIDEMIRFAEGEVARQTRELQREGASFVLPEDWKRINLSELANTIHQEFESGLPTYNLRSNEWLDAADLNALPGIGFARNMQFGVPARLANIVNVLKEFGGDPAGRIVAQANIPGPTLRSGGAAYIWQVVAVDASKPPTALDDVREQVREDLLTIAEYERMEARASEIEQRAIRDGLQAIADDYDAFPQPQRNIGLAPPGSFLTQMRINSTSLLPPVGRHEEAIQTIVDRGRAIIDDMLAKNRSFDDLTVAERTFIVPVPDKLSLVLVQLSDLRPMTRERIASFTLPVADLIMNEELGEDPMAIFSEEGMFKRYNYAGTGGEDESSDEETDLAAARQE